MSRISAGFLSPSSGEITNTRGWFIGHFLDRESPFFSEDFEAKWDILPKGQARESIVKNRRAKTISILISGEFKIIFPQEEKEVTLTNPGDYAFFEPGIYHTYNAIQDSVVLTLRWPSVPNDQEQLKSDQ